MTRAVLALALAVVGGGVAAADPAPPPPYKVYWSFPNDDQTAIDVDNPDLGGSKWEDALPKFAADMLKCNLKRSKLGCKSRSSCISRPVGRRRRDIKPCRPSSTGATLC